MDYVFGRNKEISLTTEWYAAVLPVHQGVSGEAPGPPGHVPGVAAKVGGVLDGPIRKHAGICQIAAIDRQRGIQPRFASAASARA